MRIPVGNFGNAVASPATRIRSPMVPADHSGTAMAQAGDVLSGIGDVMMRDRLREEEKKRQEDQALIRAKAANAILDREIAVKDIASSIDQDVTAGTLSYKDVEKEYRKRLDALPAHDTNGMDPVTAENFAKGIKRADFHGDSAVTGIVQKARAADFRAQADGLLDKLGKKAGLPGADVSAINAYADTPDAEAMGRTAYGAAWEKKKQDWKDANWYDSLNQRAMASRDDIKAIDGLQKAITAGEFADKLDSGRRNTLVARLDGYKTSLIQRQEAAAARAQRQQEMALKRAEAEFNTFQSMADKGTILDPHYIDRAMKMTAGTPYQAGVVAMAKQAQETGGIAAQPLRVQQAMLDQIDKTIAQNGRSPELDKRREQIAKVLEGSQRDLSADGLRAGLERGVISDVAPLDLSSPDAIAASIGKRLEQADQVSTWAGRSVSPLDAREAEQLRGMLDALPAKAKSAAVATLSETVGPRASSAIAQQLDKSDKALSLAFATAGSRTTADRYTSELILKGATAIKDGTAMKDDKKVTGWKASIAAQVDGAFTNEKEAQATKEAAYLIAAGLASENGGSVGGDDIARAVRIAIGGDIIERKGKKLPIPAGMSEADFDKRLASVGASDIEKQAPGGRVIVGGAEMQAADFAASIPGQELIYAGPGRYAVVVRGRPVRNVNGQPIIVKVQ